MRDRRAGLGLRGTPVILMAAMGLVLASCASGQAAATGAASSQTSAATPTEPSIVAPSSTAPAQDARSATASAPGSSPTSANQIRLVLAPEGNQAKYIVREQLAELSFPSDAIGTTSVISGEIVLDRKGSIASDQSEFTVDLRTLQSDRRQRDGFIQRNTLETSQFPTAAFVPTSVQGLPSPLPTSGPISFKLGGNLTIHGVTRPATWDVNAQISGNDLTGTATTSFTFEDFGMQVPRVMVVLSVEDNIKLEYDFHLTLAGRGS